MCSKVDLSTQGVYTATFMPSAGLPEKIIDVRGILTSTVIVNAIQDVKIASVLGLENKTFKVGTHISEIRKALPEKITVKDANDIEYTVYGYWTSENYVDKSGEYTFNFNIVSELPTYVKDLDGLMSVKVNIESSGCNGSISVSILVLPLVFVAVLLLKKRGLN